MKIKLTLIALLLMCGAVYGQEKCSTGESKFYVTGLYHTATLNDTTLPPIEVCGKSRLDAFTRIGATVWTETEWQRVSVMRAEQDRLIRVIEGKPKHAHAPQKPSEPKPVTLSLEASQQWMEAQRQINELQLKIDNLRLQQTVIALGEGVPKGYAVGGRDDQGRIFYVPAPKAKP